MQWRFEQRKFSHSSPAHQIEHNRLSTIFSLALVRSFCHTHKTTGFDGGQRQWFIMEIFDQQTNGVQANISSKYAVFTVNGLESGKLLKIVIYAVNIKGRSEAIQLESFTLKEAEKQTGELECFRCRCRRMIDRIFDDCVDQKTWENSSP